MTTTTHDALTETRAALDRVQQVRNTITDLLNVVDEIEAADHAAAARAAEIPTARADRLGENIADAAGTAAGRLRYALSDLDQLRRHLNTLTGAVSDATAGRH